MGSSLLPSAILRKLFRTSRYRAESWPRVVWRRHTPSGGENKSPSPHSIRSSRPSSSQIHVRNRPEMPYRASSASGLWARVRPRRSISTREKSSM